MSSKKKILKKMFINNVCYYKRMFDRLNIDTSNISIDKFNNMCNAFDLIVLGKSVNPAIFIMVSRYGLNYKEVSKIFGVNRDMIDEIVSGTYKYINQYAIDHIINGTVPEDVFPRQLYSSLSKVEFLKNEAHNEVIDNVLEGIHGIDNCTKVSMISHPGFYKSFIEDIEVLNGRDLKILENKNIISAIDLANYIAEFGVCKGINTKKITVVLAKVLLHVLQIKDNMKNYLDNMVE